MACDEADRGCVVQVRRGASFVQTFRQFSVALVWMTGGLAGERWMTSSAEMKNRTLKTRNP
jgi:hypothetical protein